MCSYRNEGETDRCLKTGKLLSGGKMEESGEGAEENGLKIGGRDTCVEARKTPTVGRSLSL